MASNRSRAHRGLALAFGVGLGVATYASHATASPGLDGTRNLSMGNATRGSSTGTNAMIINPAGLSYAQQFSIEPAYQVSVRDRTHGLGAFLGDSLNNPRFALGVSYVFMRGTPRLGYIDPAGDEQSLDLQHYGHEAAGVLSVSAVKNWLYIALKPKYQYTSLRYLDDDGEARDANKKLNAFGLDAALAVNLLGFVRIAVVGTNLVGQHEPAWTEDEPIELEGVAADPDADLDPSNVRRVSDYPIGVSHGLAVFPLGTPNFSLNFDGSYDFTSYKNQDKHVRLNFAGAGEFIVGGVPIRVGGYWDGRGRDKIDDRGYVTFGTGYIRPAKLGGVGFDIGLGVSQQVSGPKPLETVIGLNIGIRIRPDL